MERIRKLVLGLSVAAGLGFAATASAGFEAEGWLTGEEAEEAMELAQEHGVPIAVMLTSFETT